MPRIPKKMPAVPLVDAFTEPPKLPKGENSVTPFAPPERFHPSWKIRIVASAGLALPGPQILAWVENADTCSQNNPTGVSVQFACAFDDVEKAISRTPATAGSPARKEGGRTDRKRVVI